MPLCKLHLLLHPALDLLVLNPVAFFYYQLAQIYVHHLHPCGLHLQLALVLVHGVYLYQLAHLLLYANE